MGHNRVLLLMMVASVSLATQVKVLPFNLPDSRFCTSCQPDKTQSFSPILTVDDACLGYLYDIQSPYTSVYDAMYSLLKTLIYINKPTSFVVHAYIECMRTYQAVFKEPYDINIFIFPATNDSTCIKVIKSGKGFKRPVPPAVLLKNETMYIYGLGRRWEKIFLDGIEDVWLNSVCNHQDQDPRRQFSSAHERILEQYEVSKYWIIKKDPPSLVVEDPKFNMKILRPCGDNSSIPPSLSEDIKRCKGQMECTLNPPPLPGSSGRKRPAQEHSESQSSNNQPSVQSGQPAAQKSKLEDQGTKIIINEFYPLHSAFSEREEFIELRVNPPPGNKKQFFKTVKIICIGTVSQKLLMVANLFKVEIPRNGYFFIKSSSLGGRTFTYVSSDDHHFKLLPGYENEAIAILLLQMKNTAIQSDWDELKLRPQRDGSKFSTDLTGEAAVWDLIRETTIDAQLYGKLLNQNISPQLNSVFSHSGCNFIIPIGDIDSELEMTSSINYCKTSPHIEPFQFNYFKLGTVTIGFPNDCSMDIKYQVQRTEHVQRNDADTVGVTNTPSSKTECPSVNILIGLTQTQIIAKLDYIHTKLNPDYTTNLYPMNTFKTETWDKIFKQDILDLDSVGNIDPYEVVPHDESHEQSSLFRCNVCHRRLQECPDSLTRTQKRSKITDGEDIPTSTSALKRKMFDHLDSQQHLTSVLYFIQKERIKMAADKGEKLMTNADPEIQQLANVMDTTFTFLHTNTAPLNANAWYETLTKIHANVGGSLHSKDTAFRIIDFIATEGTAKIFRYLIQKDQPFTLILDGSADNRNHHCVIVYMQALEGEMTIPYFAFFLKLGTSFTAESYLKALKEKVKLIDNDIPGFEEYFIRRLVAVVTDSAKVMELFHTKLNAWIDRKNRDGESVKIVSIYCLAHKLNLSSRNSITPLKSDVNVPADSPLCYFNYVEKFMQSSYVWFKWAGKRIGLFRELVQEEGLPKVEFKELHAERWISSEYSTVKNFVTAWKTARLALEKMLAENPKDSKLKSEIESYDAQFRDKTVLITIHFLWDFTAAFKVWSEFLQRMAGLLIDQLKYFEQLQRNLDELQQFASPVLTEFLKNCKCNEKIGCTLTEYEDASTINCYGMDFGVTNSDAPKFSDAATSLLIKVKDNIIKYIPYELLSNFYVLHPRQFPASKESLNMQYPPSTDNPFARVYAAQEVARLATMLGIKPDEFLEEWQQLIESILALDSWKDLRVIHDANIFWSLALRRANIKWTSRTRFFIRALKTVSPGSVACETGFSIFNNIKTKTRMGMSDSHVESIMQILINGPKNVNEFNSNYYATHWLLSGHTKPKPEMPVNEKMCESIPEEAFEILDDTELDHESGLSLFPFQTGAVEYEDIFVKMSKQKDFVDNTKEKRSKARIRSKIF